MKLCFLTALGFFFLVPSVLPAEVIQNDDCLACHDLLNAREFSASVHGSLDCTMCHGGMTGLPHPEKLDPVDCAGCHQKESRAYSISSHGKAFKQGSREAAACLDCHGSPHAIKSHLDPESRTYPTAVATRICGQCHAAERIVTKYELPADRLKTYLDSYHGLASQLGAVTVANCASCHGAHDILPSSDPQSTVHKSNLPKTCGKCHPGASESLTRGPIHMVPSPSENRAVFYVRALYLFLIVTVIGGMALHNLLDFIVKLRRHYERKKQEAGSIRFTANERLQHLILMVTFAMLAYTGFALKWPQAWWASPFTFFDTGRDWRGILHRALAVIFVSLCFYHLIFILLTRRGRQQIRDISPGKKDFSDLGRVLRQNLGLSKEKIRLGRYSYVEKTEYWALVWGSFIMIATGIVLTFENIFMKHIPKWAFDVATAVHFYEAVLATLAIAVWHFYFTIFDPDCYPLNWSMFTGKAPEAEKGTEGPPFSTNKKN